MRAAYDFRDFERRETSPFCQVLQEFFVNVVQKIPKPIDKQQAKEIVRWISCGHTDSS